MKVLWTAPAATAFRRLSGRLREAVLERIEMIADCPDVYPVRRHPPYEGVRYAPVEHCCVSYVTAEDALVILAVFPARRRR